MSAFSAHWLALREPLDSRSRDREQGALLAEHLGVVNAGARRLTILDLGAGTGANLRFAAPLLGHHQHWVLVEQDPLLVAAVEPCSRSWAHTIDAHLSVRVLPQDPSECLAIEHARFSCHARHLALDLATQLDRLPLTQGCLLAASALLDLVSREWLTMLITRASGVDASVWFALSYDGRMQLEPEEPEDAEVRELINRHQRIDKGFGPALGPEAVPVAQQLLVTGGYTVDCATSDWRIKPEEQALQYALLDGWFAAACETSPLSRPVLEEWLLRRRTHVQEGRSELQVGHLDLLGYPPVEKTWGHP